MPLVLYKDRQGRLNALAKISPAPRFDSNPVKKKKGKRAGKTFTANSLIPLYTTIRYLSGYIIKAMITLKHSKKGKIFVFIKIVYCKTFALSTKK